MVEVLSDSVRQKHLALEHRAPPPPSAATDLQASAATSVLRISPIAAIATSATAPSVSLDVAVLGNGAAKSIVGESSGGSGSDRASQQTAKKRVSFALGEGSVTYGRGRVGAAANTSSIVYVDSAMEVSAAMVAPGGCSKEASIGDTSQQHLSSVIIRPAVVMSSLTNSSGAGENLLGNGISSPVGTSISQVVGAGSVGQGLTNQLLAAKEGAWTEVKGRKHKVSPKKASPLGSPFRVLSVRKKDEEFKYLSAEELKEKRQERELRRLKMHIPCGKDGGAESVGRGPRNQRQN